MIGLGEGVHSRSQRSTALAICLALIGVALLAVRYSSLQGPEIKPFLPICATIWALADLMTAFLLLAQFYVNGTTFLTVLAAAYAVSGLLTFPYLFAFPGLFDTGKLTVADQQISVCLWAIWHATFPGIVAISVLVVPKITPLITSRTTMQRSVWITVVATLSVSGALTALVFGERSALPHLILHGHFQPGFTHVVAPVLAALNLLGCALVLRRGRNLTTLNLWLFVAMFTAILDSLLNSMSPSRYSYGWYIGKFETVMTASVVLGILLCEIARNVALQKQNEVALRESELRYRSMANAMPQIAFTASVAGIVDYVNDRWIAYTGLSLEETSKQIAAPVTHPEDREKATAAWLAAIAAGTDYEAEQRLRRSADGVFRWHLMRAVPVRDVDGRILQWFGTGTDIDDQKQAAAAIAQTRDEALQTAKMKSQFVATMSHEIRTPMSGVIGMLELLLLTPLNDEQREFANVARDSGQSLLRVINDILDFSKIDAGRLELDSAEFDVAAQIKSVVDLLQTKSVQKAITLTSRIDENVPSIVMGDPGRLRQILMNFVGNALKFTPAGGLVRITASVEPGEYRTLIRFAVHDTGIGIAPEVQARLFEPFSQADGSISRTFGGTGLGLSICKQLVSLMGGTIGVDSIEGQGACFWFSIPFLNRSSARRAIGPPTDEPGERRAKTRARTEKILLVEDNDVNTLLARRQLNHLGFQVITAANGREAFAAVQAEHFDLIFMDCHMPEMDGFEATRQIRKLDRGRAQHVPIVAMTADVQSDDKAACIAAGMDDYLAKPCAIANLGVVLDRWLPA